MKPDAAFVFLGVDAGATRCRVRLRDLAGNAIAQAEGPAGNIYVDYDQAIAAIRSTCDAALYRAGLAQRKAVAIGLGVAGFQSSGDAPSFARAFQGFRRVAVGNDATTACLGAHGGGDGGLIISGTGSAGIARVAGKETIIGGRGFLLGDDGSAARIGADALRAALRAHDGLEDETPLTRDLLAGFSGGANGAVQWALTAAPQDYGALAPQTLAAALQGDRVGLACVEAAVRAIAAIARALQRLGAQRIALAGGLGEPLRRFFDAGLSAMLLRPQWDAADGAILLAGGPLPAETSGHPA